MRRLAVPALALAASVAHANGRPPLTNGISFRPGDPHTFYVRSTFGLVISPDDGCTMYWICEDNIGYGGTFDPVFKVAADGSIFATTYAGLRVSRDGGCSFTTNASLPANTWVAALDISPTGEIWIGTASSGAPNDVYASSDNGTVFAPRGLASRQIWWKSVKVAPSHPTRVYVAGYQVAGARLPSGGQAPPVAHLERSDDDGASWTDEPLAGVKYGPTPILMVDAVDPANPDVAYVVSIGANPPNGDLVYRSNDGGVTLAEVLATTDTVRDIVVTGATTVLVATQLGGSFASTDGGRSFSKMPSAPQLACLGLSPGGTLIGCGANWQPDSMSLAKSTDSGSTWSKVWRFVNLDGPLHCPAGTAEHDTCADQEWSALRQQFGASGPVCGDDAGHKQLDVPHPGPSSPRQATPKRSGGCCDAGDDATTALTLGGALALWLGGRRRRPRA
jgi:uncharacterized protein (TIGR03382 family)